jgi:thiol-disulfide isomerase/thioredoxin
MNMKKKRLVALLLFIGIHYAVAQDSIQLHVGDPAPAIAFGQWFKGTPVEKFDPQKIYVMEFWATWCGPCREAMPHLTKLAKEYKDKITFIGVDVWEGTHNIEGKSYEELSKKAGQFVSQMGDNMGYNVAGDTKESHMVNSWLNPAGIEGIPATFLIKNDSIIWIGHPLNLDTTLQAYFAGRYNINNERNLEQGRRIASQRNKATLSALVKTYEDAFSSGDPARGLTVMDSIVAARPELINYIYTQKVQYYLNIRDIDGLLLLVSEWENKNMLGALTAAAFINATDWLPDKAYQKALQVSIDAKNSPGLKSAPSVTSLLIAQSYWRLGKIPDAVTHIEKAIDEVKNEIAAGDYPAQSNSKTLAEYQSFLTRWQSGETTSPKM